MKVYEGSIPSLGRRVAGQDQTGNNKNNKGKIMSTVNQPKSLCRKWKAVIESNLGKPLTNRINCNVIATLLETQNKLNRGALMESANVSSDVAQYQQYALPLIRRQFPELLAMNTVAVIPTTTPHGIYFALRYLYDNEPLKTAAFRQGQKQEIGYDLVADHTGFASTFNPWSTGAGEMLSNYSEGTDVYGRAFPYSTDGASYGQLYNNFGGDTMDGNDELGTYAYNIKKASIKVISGAIRVGTRAIKSHYTLELQQDMAAAHGQDVEALLLEGLQFEIQQEIDREILMAMVMVAQNEKLGGEKVITVDLAKVDGAAMGRWSAERIAGGIVNTLIAVSRKISLTTRMGCGNFAICSADVCAAIATLNNGIYTANYLNTDATMQPNGGVADAGALLNGQIKLYQDIYANASYALVGYKGSRQGESGIIMMPYIPYIFTKTAGQEDGSPRLIVKSRYAIVANLLGAGQFYRLVQFQNVNSVITGIDLSQTPWQSNGSFSGDSLEPGMDYVLDQDSELVNAPGGLSFQNKRW